MGTQDLAFDVPESLFDTAQHAGEDRAAAVERVTINGLPVMHNIARVFANQIRCDLLHSRGARLRAAFEDRFAKADDSGVRVDFQEEPAGFDEESLQLRDLQLRFELWRFALSLRHRARVGLFGLWFGAGAAC